MKHDELCEEFYQSYLRELEEYNLRWPNHCRACRGSGQVIHADFGLYGGDYCPECIRSGKCPRCGESFGEPDYYYCSHCGWADEPDAILDARCPEQPGCICGDESEEIYEYPVDGYRHDEIYIDDARAMWEEPWIEEGE